jgi:hypothetical protein
MSFDMEKALREALQREEPSPDFTARVMARVAEQPQTERVVQRSESLSWWQRLAGFFQVSQLHWAPNWAVAGALACLLVIAGLGIQRYREQQQQLALERAEGERAKEQVLLALQITSAKLNVAQRKIKESSERELTTSQTARQ